MNKLSSAMTSPAKILALYERAENATDRKEAKKVLKKIRKLEEKAKKKQQKWFMLF